ncbi:glycoside hydrolase family 55 protein [Sphingomonas morindae]|uniref:Glycoside hydrolase family 55 protein n=1 Tax=Sphingomonas morindae TaxID=1541170 RepID=A0ABY4X7U4_9SPHN|nr:glycoside hydrolase family 55 protein [Sphingomonas morindae]USI72997.1 glycoside hydrolase family 55 protein [Sphingomonas morindae]
MDIQTDNGPVPSTAEALAAVASASPVLLKLKRSATGAVDSSLPAEVLNVVWATTQFGADPTGSVDSTGAIVNAVNALPYGGEVRLGPGTFKVSDLPILPDGVVLVGDGTYATVLIITSASGSVAPGAAGGIRNMRVTCSAGSDRTLAPLVDIQKNAGFCENVEFTSYTSAVRVGSVKGNLVVNPRIENCRFSSSVVGAGTGAIYLANYADATVAHCTVTGPLTGPQPDYGLRVHNGDTFHVLGCNITKHGAALLMDLPAGTNNFATRVTSSLFDSSDTISGNAQVSSAQITPSGSVWGLTLSSSWFGLSAHKSGLTIAPAPGGTVDGVIICACEFPGNADCGLLVVGDNVKNVNVVGGTSSGNTFGLRFVSTSYFTVSGGHIAGPVAGRGPNRIGINIDAGPSGNYSIDQSVLLAGNTTAPMFDGGTGPNRMSPVNPGAFLLASLKGVQDVNGGTPPPAPCVYIDGGVVKVRRS